VQQPLQQVRPALVADAEAAAAEQPGERALHHPPMAAQPLAGVDPAAGDARGDVTSPERTPQVGRVVGLVGVQLGRAPAGPAGSPAWTDDRRDRVDQGKQLGRVVGVGGREADGEGDAGAVDDQVVRGARLAAVGRVGAGLLAPLLARTLRLSRLARLQAMAASSPSQLSSRACSFSQTPAPSQSRRRRQQVHPLPQPSSLGNSRQGQPVRSTKTMPPRAARSGTRGRPPLGLGGSVGSSGSMASQRSSGTSGSLIAGAQYATPNGFATRS
jgi:hypothetical protein